MSGELIEYGTQINDEHRKAVTAAQSAITHALECGRLLSEAKAQAQHGTWLPWLMDNCEVSERVAQGYMRLHAGQAKLANTKRVSDFNIRDALTYLADSRTEYTVTEVPKEAPRPKEFRVQFAEREAEDEHPIVREELRTPKSAHDIAFDLDKLLPCIDKLAISEALEAAEAVKGQINIEDLHVWKALAKDLHELAHTLEEFVGDIGVVDLRSES